MAQVPTGADEAARNTLREQVEQPVRWVLAVLEGMWAWTGDHVLWLVAGAVLVLLGMVVAAAYRKLDEF